MQKMKLKSGRRKTLGWVVLLTLFLSSCAQSPISEPTPTPALKLSSRALAYPATFVGGSSVSQAATLTNTGIVPLSVAVAISGSDDFTQIDSCPPELQPLASCTVWASFAPTQAAARSGSLTIVSNGSIQALTLAGNGIANPPPTFAPALNGSTVFLGASIVQYWPMPANNFGIAGQETSEMLARFPAAVLGHGFARVVILGGSNDITNRLNLTGTTIPNLAAMARMAQSAGLEVVLSQLPPITLNGVSYNSQVVAANAAIRTLAIENGYLLVDYYTPMVGHPEYFVDGEHPNVAGYTVMEAALAATVTR